MKLFKLCVICVLRRRHAGDVQRTHTICWKNTDKGWWDFIDNWDEIGVFSWTHDQQIPLPGNWDDKGFSLWSLGMYDSWNKKIVFVDGCLSAEYLDMAYAYGVFSLQGQGSLDQVYIGWKIKVGTSPESIGEFLLGDTTAGVRMFWERMGLGNSIEQAFNYIAIYGSTQTKKSFFGMDTIWDRGEDDNIVITGLGAINLNQIRLGY
jgi:hypothetical protein